MPSMSYACTAIALRTSVRRERGDFYDALAAFAKIVSAASLIDLALAILQRALGTRARPS